MGEDKTFLQEWFLTYNTFCIFSDSSLVIRAKGPARVKNAKGSANGQKRKWIRWWSKRQQG